MDQKKHVCETEKSFFSSYTLHWETAKEKVSIEENVGIIKSKNKYFLVSSTSYLISNQM